MRIPQVVVPVVILGFFLAAFGQEAAKPTPPLNPFTRLTAAKTIFIRNGGGSEIPLKVWNRRWQAGDDIKSSIRSKRPTSFSEISRRPRPAVEFRYRVHKAGCVWKAGTVDLDIARNFTFGRTGKDRGLRCAQQGGIVVGDGTGEVSDAAETAGRQPCCRPRKKVFSEVPRSHRAAAPSTVKGQTRRNMNIIVALICLLLHLGRCTGIPFRGNRSTTTREVEAVPRLALYE